MQDFVQSSLNVLKQCFKTLNIFIHLDRLIKGGVEGSSNTPHSQINFKLIASNIPFADHSWIWDTEWLEVEMSLQQGDTGKIKKIKETNYRWHK